VIAFAIAIQNGAVMASTGKPIR